MLKGSKYFTHSVLTIIDVLCLLSLLDEYVNFILVKIFYAEMLQMYEIYFAYGIWIPTYFLEGYAAAIAC